MPRVARPQLNRVESSGKPRLLKEAFAAKTRLTNNQMKPLISQKKTTSSPVRPRALNRAARGWRRRTSSSQTTPTYDDREPEGILQGLPHAVEAARAPVLPHHRPDGPREGEDPAECDGRHPVDDRRGRDGLVAEAGDDAQRKGVRRRRRDVGQDRRHGDRVEGPRVGQRSRRRGRAMRSWTRTT